MKNSKFLYIYIYFRIYDDLFRRELAMKFNINEYKKILRKRIKILFSLSGLWGMKSNKYYSKNN